MTEINVPTLRQRPRVEHVPTEAELYAAAMAKKAEQDRREANDTARALLRQNGRCMVGGVR